MEDKINYKDLYRKLVESDWFKRAYGNMSVDFILVDE